MNDENIFSRFLRYISLIFIIAFGILPIIASCGGGGGEGEVRPTSWEKVVGPEGGTVEVTEPSSPIYGMKIEIPAGALAEQATIIISEDESAEPAYPLPAGLTSDYPAVNISSDRPFVQDVKITFPIQGMPGNVGEILSAFYYRTSDGRWTIVSPTKINASQLIIETDHLSLWRWGIVFLEEVEQETVTAAMEESVDDYNEVKAGVETKMAPFLSPFNDLISMYELYNCCEDRQNMANFLTATINEYEPEIAAILNSTDVKDACDPDCTLEHMLVTDEQMRLFKWLEREFWLFIAAGAFGGGSGPALIGDFCNNLVGKLVMAQGYRNAVEELGCDYRCVFKNGDGLFWNVALVDFSYIALGFLYVVETYNPCVDCSIS